MKRSLKTTLLIFTFCMGTSCSQFLPHRDFLTEMEQEDGGFLRPGQDFPVMGGDSGEMGESSRDRKNRTPASAQDILDERHTLALEKELEALESELVTEDAELYGKYKHHLATTSEKIYFLKIGPYDREEYLRSRGFVESPETASHSEEEAPSTGAHTSVILGMSKAEVMENWGKPARVEIAGNPSYENERWAYSTHGATKYLYFESGRVEGWE